MVFLLFTLKFMEVILPHVYIMTSRMGYAQHGLVIFLGYSPVHEHSDNTLRTSLI